MQYTAKPAFIVIECNPKTGISFTETGLTLTVGADAALVYIVFAEEACIFI